MEHWFTKPTHVRMTPPLNIVQSLDGMRSDLNAYRHIRGIWYPFYEFIPD
jgi:hypothetical protein